MQQQTDGDCEVPTGPLPEVRGEEPDPGTGNGDTHSDSHDDAALQTEENIEPASEQDTSDSTTKKYPSRVRKPPLRYQ